KETDTRTKSKSDVLVHAKADFICEWPTETRINGGERPAKGLRELSQLGGLRGAVSVQIIPANNVSGYGGVVSEIQIASLQDVPVASPTCLQERTPWREGQHESCMRLQSGPIDA